MTTTNIERPSLKRKLPLNSPAYIKTDVLLRPPVHFNDPECLTPFELAVAFGIIRLARHSLNEVWHQEAFERGGIRIEGEVKAGFPAYLKEYKRTEARCGEGYYKRKGSFEDGRRPPPKRETLKSIGKDSYKRHFADARNKAREVIEVEVSVRGLLEAAGLSADGRNTKKLDATLDRLMRPTRNTKFPSVLFAHRVTKKGRLHLEVRGSHVVALFRYCKVPMPLPTASKSPVTCALYLFLHGVGVRRTSEMFKHAIDYGELCKRLGINARWHGEAARALDQALAAVNKHLGQNGSKYEFTIDDQDNRVRFVRKKRLLRIRPVTAKKEKPAPVPTRTADQQLHREKEDRRRLEIVEAYRSKVRAEADYAHYIAGEGHDY